MGTRLYPMTQNVAILELLAGVPVGTAARKSFIEGIQATPQLLAKVAIARKKEWESDGRKPIPFKEYYWMIDSDIRQHGQDQLEWFVKHYIETDYALYDSFLGEGWGRLQVSEDWLERRDLDPNVGHTIKPEEVMFILGYQAQDDRLDFDIGLERVRAKLYIGKPFIASVGLRRYQIPEEQWRYGEWVAITLLEGLCWS